MASHLSRSIKSVQSVQNQGKICILDIDVQAVQSIKKYISQNSSSQLNPVYLFIAPPSLQTLEQRLRGRNTENEEAIQKRLANAKTEVEYGLQEGNFDAVLVNDDLERCFEELVANLIAYFPELNEIDGTSAQDKTNATTSAPLEDVPPPVVDPLSFPKTEEGLTDLLNAIDKECPLGNYNQTELNYQASDVYIAAGKKLDIPLPPVEQDGSKIEWTVTLVDEHEERLDIEFGLAAIVDGEEVVVREMGRILSPSRSEKSEDDGVDTDDATSSASSTASNGGGAEKPSAKGKFTVANSAPVTVIIKLDNSYSWWTPKKINYSFTIIPPVDDNMIQRSLRAKSIVPKLLEGKQAAVEAKEKQRARADALGRIKSEMEVKLNDLKKQVDDGRKSIEAIQKRSEEAEEEAKVKANEIKECLTAVKKEEQSIDECSKHIVALEEECARLKKQWEELKIERSVRLEEKTKLEQKAEITQKERIQLQEEIQNKREEEKVKSTQQQSLEKDQRLMQENLNDLEKEKSAREAEEVKCLEELKFLERQMDVVKLRFIEPKTM